MGAEQSTEAAAPAQPSASESVEPAAPKSQPSALVICGPSGVGKGTLIQKLMQDSDQFGFSVSHTTRSPRPGEENGVHYYFSTKEQVGKEIAEGKFLEYAEVHGNLYGTSVQAVQTVLQTGKVCVLDIDVQGARQVRKSALKAIFVFIAPPSLEELEKRLVGRNTETKEQIEKRLRNAKAEISSLNEKGLFDYLLINDDLDETLNQLRAVAQRALQGLDPEPGRVPEKVILEEEPQAPDSIPPAPAKSLAVQPAQSAHAAPSAPDALQKLRNKVALVTGASSGIGWATSEALAKSGLRVVAVARRRDRLEKLQQHILKLGIPAIDFLPVVCDITKDAEVAALPKIVAKRWPDSGIDVLVNNAGLARNDASLFAGNTASWVEMVSTNVLGLCMCTREVVQDMKRRNSYGHIVNLVGLSGHRIPDAPQGGSFYAATKFAVKALTEGLRQEARSLQVPLKVSGISPGIVETEFFNVRAFGDSEDAKRATRQFKCLQPEDVANAVLWALSAPEHMEVNDIVVRPAEQVI